MLYAAHHTGLSSPVLQGLGDSWHPESCTGWVRYLECVCMHCADGGWSGCWAVPTSVVYCACVTGLVAVFVRQQVCICCNKERSTESQRIN
jgi:hypothetical protein